MASGSEVNDAPGSLTSSYAVPASEDAALKDASCDGDEMTVCVFTPPLGIFTQLPQSVEERDASLAPSTF